MASTRAAMILLVAALVATATLPRASAGKDSEGWFVGRATYYTDNEQGSCRYGKPSNVFYAAWPDTQEDAPACGTCWEVRCVDRSFNDGFGQAVYRSKSCYDENKAVVVKVIDSCPCVHENFYSNQRWCCGDADHLDISKDVFAMLAAESDGVIGLRWRAASCDHLGLVDGTSQQPASSPAADNSGSTTDGGDTHDRSKAASSEASSSADGEGSSVVVSVDAHVGDEQLMADDHWVPTDRASKWFRMSGGWKR